MDKSHLFQATAETWHHLHLEKDRAHMGGGVSLLLMPSWVKELKKGKRRGREIPCMQICYSEVGELKLSGSEEPEVSVQVWSGM